MKEFIKPQEKGPVEIAIESKVPLWNCAACCCLGSLIHGNPCGQLIEEFDPATIHIVNESHMHAHHAAMKGNTNKETHFRYVCRYAD